LRVWRCIQNGGVGKCWVDGECSGGGRGTIGGAKAITEDHSESLISSGALSSLETSSQSITITWSVCPIVIMLVCGHYGLGVVIMLVRGHCGLGVVGVGIVEVLIGSFRLVFKAPL